MRLFDPTSGKLVWDSADPYAGPVPPQPEGRTWVKDMGAPLRGPEKQPAPQGIEYYLGGTGIPEKLGVLNKTLNPVEAIGGSMQASQRMFAPNRTGWQRVADTGDMLSGVAGVVGPAAVASKLGAPAASALQEAFVGMSMSPQAKSAKAFMADEFGGMSVPGFRAFHGSPHDFDKFSMDKIGTGEGAQAYGHGLYFAGNEDVAKGYRDALSLDAGFTYKGKTGLTRDQLAEEITKEYGGSYLDNVTTPRGVADGVMDELVYGPANRKLGPERAALREKMLAEIGRTNPGKMYEVQINANPDDFLDWDKPITEQPKAVQDLARDMDLSGAKGATKGMIQAWRDGRDVGALPSGADIDRALSAYGDNRPAATEALKSAGVKGVKYFDAGSRGAGDGSRNFVVFDENLISIVKKYGIAGAAALLGVSAADVKQAMAAPQQKAKPIAMGAQ